jgi:hypothetical protein
MFDFAENKEVADLTAVPENIRPFYQKADEEDDASPYVLKQNDPVVAGAVALATGLHASLVKERNEHKITKTNAKTVDLTPLADYGTDPVSIQEGFNKKVSQLEAQIKDGGAVKQQITEMKQEMTQAHQAALEAEQQRVKALTSQLDDYMINTEITTAAVRHGLNPKLIAPFARESMKVDVNPETGQRSVVVLDKSGSTQYSMEYPGELATVDELLADMSKKQDYKQLARSGDGARRNAARVSTTDRAEMSATDKIAHGLNKKRK